MGFWEQGSLSEWCLNICNHSSVLAAFNTDLPEISWTENKNSTDLPAAPRAPATVLSLLDLGCDGLWIGGERRVPDLGVAQLAVDHVVETDENLKGRVRLWGEWVLFMMFIYTSIPMLCYSKS